MVNSIFCNKYNSKQIIINLTLLTFTTETCSLWQTGFKELLSKRSCQNSPSASLTFNEGEAKLQTLLCYSVVVLNRSVVIVSSMLRYILPLWFSISLESPVEAVVGVNADDAAVVDSPMLPGCHMRL